MCSQFRWVNQILFFCRSSVNSKCFALEPYCKPLWSALLEGVLLPVENHLNSSPGVKGFWAWVEKSFLSEPSQPLRTGVLPFPPHGVVSVQEFLTEEFWLQPILRQTVSISSIPCPLPISWWACARRYSWESCHYSLTLQWLFLGKLQTAAQWNDSWILCVEIKTAVKFCERPLGIFFPALSSCFILPVGRSKWLAW